MSTTRTRKRITFAARTAGLALASVLLCYACTTNAPALIASGAGASLAAASVSVEAGVAANPDNTLEQQLEARSQELDRREAALNQAQASASAMNSLGLYSLLASIALFALVLLNFYYDARRDRKRSGAGAPLLVDLRAGR